MEKSLKTLAAEVERSRHLASQIESLTARREELSEKLYLLEHERNAEAADVERLEGGSLSALIYKMLGTYDKKLAAESLEAEAAAVKYDAAKAELAAVTEQIAKLTAERKTLAGCEIRYRGALADRAEELRVSDGKTAAEFAALEAEIAALEEQLAELDEAIETGREALGEAESALELLMDAGDLAAYDVFGGGAWVDFAKHERMDDAQVRLEWLQSSLAVFRAELGDVDIRFDADVSLDGLSRFADWYVDDIITDWAVKDKIATAGSQVRSVIGQLERVLGRLDEQRDELARSIARKNDRLEALLRR
ncbi:MAG: hypothetical protein E7632_09870 [Ruminococcaceae bacterium]|nr:hypothetical protein [Oscillospiraceae bacterium]